MNYNKATFLASYGLLKQLPNTENMEIAFAGRSNVGKSSLLNKLLNRKKLARVSSMPGKTITINFYQVGDVRLVDLPGYGYAKVAKTEKQRWAELIEGYFKTGRNLALVVQLIDIRHSPTKLDLEMINYIIDAEIPFIVVLTKMDKLSPKQQKERYDALVEEIPCGDQIKIIACSAENGAGIDELKKILDEVAGE
jgi:GTP-binding protein